MWNRGFFTFSKSVLFVDFSLYDFLFTFATIVWHAFKYAAKLLEKAKMYQEYMKSLPIPSHHGTVVIFKTWMDLGKSLKKLYNQPLHYLTNVALKQWDKMRLGAENEHDPLDVIIHPCKAEATIWLIEENHRLTSAPHHIARMWLSDRFYLANIDSICPQLWDQH